MLFVGVFMECIERGCIDFRVVAPKRNIAFYANKRQSTVSGSNVEGFFYLAPRLPF